MRAGSANSWPTSTPASPAEAAVTAIVEMVEFYLAVLVAAGDYAKQIQPQASRVSRKEGHNAWVQAITDADPSVQAFLEVATLGRFPGVGFYGEEEDTSRNARYFPPDAELKVWLDPINGTFLYQNQEPGWDIVLSITSRGHLMASISYMPMRGVFYLGIRGLGAFTGSRTARTLGELAPLRTQSGSRLCLIYQAPGVVAKLKPAWRAFDIVADHDPARDYENLDDLFTGRMDAFASAEADLLDWGAMAFIVAQAGGTVTTLDGQPFDGFEKFGNRSVSLLASASAEVHGKLLARLSNEPGRHEPR
jgi:fructose-1,6-bisphosphatase/inositol monophosphatase family enzyme